MCQDLTLVDFFLESSADRYKEGDRGREREAFYTLRLPAFFHLGSINNITWTTGIYSVDNKTPSVCQVHDK